MEDAIERINVKEKNFNPALYQADTFLLNETMSEENLEDYSHEDFLIKIGKTQDRDSFIRIFEYFAPRVKSFLIKGGINAETADELAQETMLTVWNKASSYKQEKASASTWIYTIARNKRIDYLRKARNQEAQLHDALQITDNVNESPFQSVDKAVLKDTMSEAIQTLPKEQAQLIEKSFYEHKTHQEIAEETNLPLGTVKSRIRLALKRLKSRLEEKSI
jgi:RNA polymerase sigma-70 factor (ECF subfamily)